MQKPSEVIGEGAYGCVHKPSLKCKSKKMNYKNKISKILLTKDAMVELNEYGTISKVDKNHKIHLGVPVKCEPNISSTVDVQSIDKCRGRDKINKHLNQYSLLVMKDGGVNLEIFADNISKLPNTPETREKLEYFWLDVHRLLKGIHVFLKHKIIHHDVKPQNIVYDETAHRLNYIDFGLMQHKKDVVKASLESHNLISHAYHWSYPFELQFLNKNTYGTFVGQPKKFKQLFFNELMNLIKSKKESDTQGSFRTFFSFVIPSDVSGEKRVEIFSQYMEDYYEMILYEIKPDNYSEFVEKSLNTFDIYGLGIALYYVLNKTAKFIEPEFVKDLEAFCYSMVNPNVFKRHDIDELLNEYEELLINNHLSEKYKIHFENNEIVEGENIPGKVEDAIDGMNPSKLSLTRNARDNLVEKSSARMCAVGRKFDISENRCIKICKNGQLKKRGCSKTAKKKVRFSSSTKRRKLVFVK